MKACNVAIYYSTARRVEVVWEWEENFFFFHFFLLCMDSESLEGGGN